MRRLYDNPGFKPSDLASTMSMTQGAISKIIDKLQAKGWIVSHENEADRRGQLIALTMAGRLTLPALARIADENDDRFFGPLALEERAYLRTLLERIATIHDWDDVPTS